MSVCWRAFWPTPTWLRLAIVPVLAFLATVSDRQYLADFWHHLARGRAIVQEGRIVNRDLFTFTVPNQPFQDVNWLTQVGYYALFDTGGLALVQVVNSLIIALTMLLLVCLCRRGRGRGRGRASAALLPAVLAGGVAFFGVWEVLAIRPQTLSMLLFVVVMGILQRSERQPWLLIWLPPLVALWSNLHGAFPAGIMLVGCYSIAATVRWARDKWAGAGRPSTRVKLNVAVARRLALCLAACVLASCLNPYGLDVYRYVGDTSAIAYERQIAEWVRPGPDRLIGIMWMASAAGIAGLLLWRWRRTGRLPILCDMFVLGCFFLLSAGSVRMVAWWMLASAPVLAELLASLAPKLAADDDADRPSLMAGGVFALVALAVVLSLPGLDRFNPLLGPSRRGPRVEEDLEAVHHYLAANANSGNIYSHFEWGEYLTWSVTPRFKVFMDGRIELYPDDIWQEYSAVTYGQGGWDEILDKQRVDYLILDTAYHAQTGLLARVADSPHWQRAFQARSAVLFVRKGVGFP